MSSVSERSDVLIIGAGSAGCVLANRLSADNNRRVTLLEAGGSDRNPIIRMPSAFYLPVRHRRYNWGYESEPEAQLNHRRLLCPRGRVLGGSSSINGMVYVRGHPHNFDRWEQLGATGWNYDNVLPYFKRAQRFTGASAPSRFRGDSGPLAVTNGQLENPLYERFLAAAQEAGYSRREDLNDDQQEGFGPLPMTVDQGVRASTAHAYLRPVHKRRNLRVARQAHALELIFQGDRALGARVLVRGRIATFEADEVVLCAGAINSPQLLMLSGIGPADDLRRLGIGVRMDHPGIGQNLMDHLEIYVQQACREPVSLHRELGLFGRARIGAQWLLSRGGLGATNHFEAGGFIRSHDDLPCPDIQFHFLPAAMQYDGSARADQHGFQAHVGPMLSASRGQLTLRSADPFDAPRLHFNYMTDAQDWVVFRSAIRAARQIFAQPAFDALRGPELRPGHEAESDEALNEFIRTHAESAYHPCGTCRMGTDATSVVDPNGRVHGLQGLSVVDASVFPQITNGNLNAPTIMVAERLADALI